MSAHPLPLVIAAGPGIEPNTNGLPGVSEAKNIVGALLTFGIIAAVAGIALSAIVWSVAASSGNPHVASKGKTGFVVAAAAALVIGGADVIITFFQNAGASL